MKTIMNELAQHSAERYAWPYEVARAYRSLKQEGQTFFWLEMGYKRTQSGFD
jgi:hypothetical protein